MQTCTVPTFVAEKKILRLFSTGPSWNYYVFFLT